MADDAEARFLEAARRAPFAPGDGPDPYKPVPVREVEQIVKDYVSGMIGAEKAYLALFTEPPLTKPSPGELIQGYVRQVVEREIGVIGRAAGFVDVTNTRADRADPGIATVARTR